ncbi:MAG: hypothetical protein JNM84_04710 [Planctomycetes bacterium]|nr:hypothetical protein [Planctomycetota bacterium]
MLPLLALALTIAPSLAIPQEPAPARREPATAGERLHALLRRSRSDWSAALELVRADFQRAPRATLEALIAALDDGTAVSGYAVESTIYSVRGNALELLEDFTDLRLDHVGREWIGFRVHDHRGMAPELEAVKPPWVAWLRSRADLPEAQWFHGLSARELHALQSVLRTPAAQWTDELLAPAVGLGSRAYPRLLHYLIDEEWAVAGERMADQANRLLARCVGGEPEALERYDLLSLDPADPLRKYGTALVRNRLAMQRAQERWAVRLLKQH